MSEYDSLYSNKAERMVQLLFNVNKWRVARSTNAHYIKWFFKQKLGIFELVIESVGREMLNSKELKLSNSD